MMEPLRDIFDEIASLENLFEAARATLASGRRLRGEGAVFKFDLEREVLRLRRDLVSGLYRHGKYRLFTVRDPKMRVIAAASVRDRVLHHAVHDVVAPRLDPMFIHDSYACRMGKGTHRALDRAHHYLRGHRYGLHLDVRSYFATIDHEILKGLLRRRVADGAALALLERVVDSTAYLARRPGAGESVTSHGPAAGDQMELGLGLECAGRPGAGGRLRGIPLGNLTSQFFANLYLNELDQYVKHTLKARHYVRYMDDMLLFADDKGELLGWEAETRAFVGERLRLELHESGGPVPTRAGLGFLGFRLLPTHRRLKRAAVARFTRRMNGFMEELAEPGGDAGEAELLEKMGQSVQSFNAHAQHGATYHLRCRLYGRYPVIAVGSLAGMGRRMTDAEIAREIEREVCGDAGDAPDSGADVRCEQVAAGANRQVSARPATTAGGAPGGAQSGYPGRSGSGGARASRRREVAPSGASQPSTGAVAVSVAAGARRAVHEPRGVALLQRQPAGGGTDAGGMDEESGEK